MCCIVLFSALHTAGGLAIANSICCPTCAREINVPNTMPGRIIPTFMLKATLSTCKTDVQDLFTQ